MHRMSVLLAPLVTVIVLSSTAYAQLPLPDTSSVLPSTSLINGVLTVGGLVVQPDEAATQEELPGLGHKFELFGSMIKDTDPENQYGNSGHSGGGAGGNEVISAIVTPDTMAFAYRKLPPGINILALTNQIGVKYYFVAPKNCVAGSPRIQLVVDSDGDGDSDFTAHGHISPTGIQIPCAMNMWQYVDLTDIVPRWEITSDPPFPTIPGIVPNGYLPWKQFASFIAAGLPSHKILAGMLLDGESCSFSAANCGKAYYDLLTIENRTLEIWQDAVKK